MMATDRGFVMRELVRASHLGRLQKLPRWRAKILVAIVKNVADWYVIVTLSVAIEIRVCDLKIHQNIRDYNRRSEQRTHADQSFGPLVQFSSVQFKWRPSSFLSS